MSRGGYVKIRLVFGEEYVLYINESKSWRWGCPYKYDEIRYVGELRCRIRNEKIVDLGVARGGGMSAIKSIKNM